MSTVEIDTSVGETYHVTVGNVRFGNGDSTYGGTFGLTVLELEPAPNAFCEGALDVVADGNVTVASNVNSTSVQHPCTQDVEDFRVLWYKLLGTSGKRVRASTCNVETDPKARLAMVVGSGTCGEFQCVNVISLDGKDCSFDTDPFGGLVTVEFDATLGDVFYIGVGYIANYRGGTSRDYGATFGLTLQELEPPLNQLCEGAVDIATDGSVTIGSNRKSTASEGICFYLLDTELPSAWYKLMGSGKRFRASVCGDVIDFLATLQVGSGTCNSLECADFCYVGDDPCGTIEVVEFDTTPGVIYYVMVGVLSPHIRTGGAFGLSVQELEPPANQFCENALAIVIGGEVASGSMENSVSSDAICTTGRTQAVWYKFVGNGQRLQASNCFDPSSGSLQIGSGSCGSLQCVETRTAGNIFCRPNVLDFDTVAGVTYYVRVGLSVRPGERGGPFELTVSAIPTS